MPFFPLGAGVLVLPFLEEGVRPGDFTLGRPRFGWAGRAFRVLVGLTVDPRAPVFVFPGEGAALPGLLDGLTLAKLRRPAGAL